MIGKILGAMIGKRVAQDNNGGGMGGALLGIGAASVLRRLGPVGLIAAAAGSYALKRHLEKRDAGGQRTMDPRQYNGA